MDYWHLGTEFSALPELNEDFIQQATPIERALAVTNHSHLLFDSFFQVTTARPMMTYSVPASLGRF